MVLFCIALGLFCCFRVDVLLFCCFDVCCGIRLLGIRTQTSIYVCDSVADGPTGPFLLSSCSRLSLLSFWLSNEFPFPSFSVLPLLSMTMMA